MRHLKAGRKLSRTSAHRKSLMQNLVSALIVHECIRTTDAKAKELRRWAERMITLGKRGDLHARRRALAFLRRKELVKRLFEEVAPRFRDRAGGYTRVVKWDRRRGDAAPLSLIEWTSRPQPKEGKRKAPPPKPERAPQGDEKTS